MNPWGARANRCGWLSRGGRFEQSSDWQQYLNDEDVLHFLRLWITVLRDVSPFVGLQRQRQRQRSMNEIEILKRAPLITQNRPLMIT